MIIGLISDTHNNHDNLNAALTWLRSKQVTRLLHLGDVTSPETIRLLDGFEVDHVIGNGDILNGEIAAALKALSAKNTSGLFFSAELAGRKIAATHGHLIGKVDELVEAGGYDFVFHGHSHRRKDDQIGSTRVINPGALGGLRAGPRSCALIDLSSGQMETFCLD